MSWWLLVDNDCVTEPKPMDAERVEQILAGLGTLLAEQPGAMDTYDTEVQLVPSTMWWDGEAGRMVNPYMALTVAKLLPGQPLGAALGEFLNVATKAHGMALRPEVYAKWRSRTYLSDMASKSGRSAESFEKLRAMFSPRGEEAMRSFQQASTHLQRSAALFSQDAADRFAAALEYQRPEHVDRDDYFALSEGAQIALKSVLEFKALIEASEEVSVPHSLSEWKQFEFEVGVRLEELSVPTERVISLLLDARADDPVDELQRVKKGLARRRKQKSESSGS